MLVVETVVRSRSEYAAGKPIKAIQDEEGAFRYQRTTQPFSKIGPVRERLEELLIDNDARSRKGQLKLT